MENELEKKAYYADLLLFYGDLLTENVKRRMTSFYLDDYSISEIAENEKVSRNAVFEALHSGEKSLDKYEEALHLREKSLTASSLLEEIKAEDDKAKRDALIERLKGEISYGI